MCVINEKAAACRISCERIFRVSPRQSSQRGCRQSENDKRDLRAHYKKKKKSIFLLKNENFHLSFLEIPQIQPQREMCFPAAEEKAGESRGSSRGSH
jgi:hypothetical protein